MKHSLKQTTLYGFYQLLFDLYSLKLGIILSGLIILFLKQLARNELLRNS